jgi:hypothetical protein
MNKRALDSTHQPLVAMINIEVKDLYLIYPIRSALVIK